MSIKFLKERAYTAPDMQIIEFKCGSVLMSSLNSDSDVEDLDDITTTLNW